MKIRGLEFDDACELISKQSLFNFLKRQEKKNLKEHGKSIAYISMYDRIYKPFIQAFVDGDILIKNGWKDFVKELK